jgi:hypothetical protein
MELKEERQEEGHLYDFSHTVTEFALGKGLEESSVDEYVFGLPEGADEILACRSIDGGFTANGRIDHCKEGSRNLDEAHATHALGR